MEQNKFSTIRVFSRVRMDAFLVISDDGPFCKNFLDPEENKTVRRSIELKEEQWEEIGSIDTSQVYMIETNIDKIFDVDTYVSWEFYLNTSARSKLEEWSKKSLSSQNSEDWDQCFENPWVDETHDGVSYYDDTPVRTWLVGKSHWVEFVLPKGQNN